MVAITLDNTKQTRRRRKLRSRPLHFATPGQTLIVCLALFVSFYMISIICFTPKEGDETNSLKSAKDKIVGKFNNKIQTMRKGRQGKIMEKELMDETWHEFVKSKAKIEIGKGSIRAKSGVLSDKEDLAPYDGNSKVQEELSDAEDSVDSSAASQSNDEEDDSKEGAEVDKGDIDQYKPIDPVGITQNVQDNQETKHDNQEGKPTDRELDSEKESNVGKDYEKEQADPRGNLQLSKGETAEVLQDPKEGAGVESEDAHAKTKGESKETEGQEAGIKLVEIKGIKPTTGVIVLGMRHSQHSPKSILSGMLVEGYGYYTGGPLMKPAEGERESYELIPSILQNDSFMFSQHLDWTAAIERYDSVLVKQDVKQGLVQSEYLGQVVETLNDANHVPWLLTDSRLCFTIKNWLPYLNSKPAVLFTWRSPLDVVRDMHKHDDSLTMVDGLKTWMKFSKAAVENSADLCRVYSGYNAIIENPLYEIKRIQNQLNTKCGVPRVAMQITEDMVNDFIDPSLQHMQIEREKKLVGVPVLKIYGKGCKVYRASSILSPEDGLHLYEEKKTYLQAMKIFCDFESRHAFDETYEWPDF